MKSVPRRLKMAVWLLPPLVVLLAACASTSPTPGANSASDSAKADLTCSLPSNCVSSRGSGRMDPLRFVGTPAQAMAVLQATLKTFPEATIVRSEPLSLEVSFTTPIGFKDQVDFQIDAQALRVDFRSRSLLGLFDFGKNGSRMKEFTVRFAKQALL